MIFTLNRKNKTKMLTGLMAKVIAVLCITLTLIKTAELRPQKSMPNVGKNCGYAVGQQKLSAKK